MFKKIPISIEELKQARKKPQAIEVTDESKFTKPIKIMGVGNYDYIDYVTGEHKNTSYKLFTLGNISVLKGASKSQKTFLQTLFASVYLNQYIDNHNNLFKVNNKIKKKVIIYDTEQHITDVKMVRDRINAITKQKNDNLKIFSLREMNYLEKIEFLEEEMQNHKDSFMILDGVKDLVRDINDYGECSELVEKLLKWSSQSNSHLTNVIHTNVNSDKARGHMGSTLYEKAETVSSVIQENKNSQIRKVTCDMVRGSRQFEDFYFEVDKLTGLPYIINPEIQSFL